MCVCLTPLLPVYACVCVTKFKKASKLWVNRFSAKITATINPQTHSQTHTHKHTHPQTLAHTLTRMSHWHFVLYPSPRTTIASCRFRCRYRNLFYRRISVWFSFFSCCFGSRTHTHTHTVTHAIRHPHRIMYINLYAIL